MYIILLAFISESDITKPISDIVKMKNISKSIYRSIPSEKCWYAAQKWAADCIQPKKRTRLIFVQSPQKRFRVQFALYV